MAGSYETQWNTLVEYSKLMTLRRFVKSVLLSQDIETEGLGLASDEEIGQDANICTLDVQLVETEEGAWLASITRKMTLGTVAVENLRPPSYPETKHSMQKVFDPILMIFNIWI